MSTDILTKRGKFFALALVAFVAGWSMVWRAATKVDVPPIDTLQTASGLTENWGKSRHFGLFFCLRELKYCLAFAEPARSNYDLEFQLRQGLPVTVRYDRKHPEAWGVYPMYPTYEIAVDGHMVISYEDMRQERISTRRFAQGLAMLCFIAFIALCALGFRTPRGRIYGMPDPKS